MGTWLAVEVVVALLAAVLWGEPAPPPDCADRPSVECDGERVGGER